VDPAAAEHLVHAYIEGWRTGDRAKILGTLAPDCVIVESLGPTYTGADKIAAGSTPGWGPATPSTAGS
jgi:hypothetical protein